MPSARRTAVYVRRSKKQGAEESTSIAVQTQECVAFVEKQGWRFDLTGDLYADSGRGAWRPGAKRPEFERLLHACADGRYDRLVVHMMDRVSRDWAQWGTILGSLPADFEIVSAVEGLSSLTNKMQVQIMAAIAEDVSTKISMRVRATKQNRAQRGEWLGSIRPFGWVPGAIDGRRALILNRGSGEPEALRSVIDMVIEGASVNEGARWLSERGFATTMPARRGPDGELEVKRAWWSNAAMMRLLRSPVLYGGPGSKSNEIVVDGDTPLIVGEPLITLDTFRRLQARLDRQKRTRSAARSSLLAGIAKCAACGYALGSGGPIAGHTAVYRCVSPKDRGNCDGCTVSRPRLDDAISLLALLLLVRPPAKAHDHPQTEHAARIQIAIDQLVSDLYSSDSPSPEVRVAMRKRLAKLEEELAAAKKVISIRRGPARLPKEVRAALTRDFAKEGLQGINVDALESFHAFRELPTAARRELVASVIDRVWVARRTRKEALAVPLEQRGQIGGRIAVALANDPDVRMPYVDALEYAAFEAAQVITTA